MDDNSFLFSLEDMKKLARLILLRRIAAMEGARAVLLSQGRVRHPPPPPPGALPLVTAWLGGEG